MSEPPVFVYGRDFQRLVFEHEVLLKFTDDEDAYGFREWMADVGERLFYQWRKNRNTEPDEAEERYKQRCQHMHKGDICLLVDGHAAPHRMLDDDYPRSGSARREYDCNLHSVAGNE